MASMDVNGSRDGNEKGSAMSFLESAQHHIRGLFSHKTRDPLHDPSSYEELSGALASKDPNAKNHEQNAPIHSIVQRKRRGKKKKEERMHFLVTLLTFGDVDINQRNGEGHTPLHLAVMSGDPRSIKVLIAFGADMNALNSDNQTPLELLGHPHLLQSVSSMLSVGSKMALLTDESVTTNGTDTQPTQKSSSATQANGESSAPITASSDTSGPEEEETPHRISMKKVRKLSVMLQSAGAEIKQPTPRKSPVPLFSCVAKHVVTAQKMLKHQRYGDVFAYYSLLHEMFKKQLSIIDDIDGPQSKLEGVDLLGYMREGRMIQMAGSRILILDGGGLRGMMQIEILSQIEKFTGKKITELFDIIIGTSTGGIVALSLVYAKRSLEDVRKFYFKAREEIFKDPDGGLSLDTKAFERTLIEQLGMELKMSDIKHPRVIIPATYKGSINLKLHLFSNIFDDDLSDQYVWKVARYTSAAPIFFTEMDDYVDGGVLANNPSTVALSALDSHFRSKGQKLPIAMVVSLGTGVFPDDDLGNINATEVLHWGKNWFKVFTSLGDRIKSLTTLLSNALTESETVSETTRCRCEAQNIECFRFNPKVKTVIAAGETDLSVLMDMILAARCLTKEDSQFQEMLKIFERVSACRSRLVAESYTEKLKNLKELLDSM